MEKALNFDLKPTIFHSKEWMGFLESVYHYQRADLKLENSTLPLMRVGPMFGDRLVSIPFSDYGGPIGEVDVDILIKKAFRLLESLRVDYIEIRTTNTNLVEKLREYGFHTASTYYSRVVDAHPGLELDDVWRRVLGRTARKMITKAIKAGIEVFEATTPRELDMAYRVYFRAVKSIGSPCHPSIFLESIKRALGNRAKIYVAKIGEESVGMSIFLVGYDRVHSWAAYSLDQYKKFGVIYLLDWKGIALANKLGLQKFDFGRTRKMSGIDLFKHHWTGEDEEIYHILITKSVRVKPPDPSQILFRTCSNVWRRLPDPLVSVLGPRIIRHIAL
jgi:hypothetical protein